MFIAKVMMMKISETTYTINKHGNLKIAANELTAMGLHAGMHVRVAFLTEDGETNTFREFMLTKNPLDAVEVEQSVLIPNELLKQANIPDDEDVQIFTVDGAIAICREPVLNHGELYGLLQTLSCAACMVDQLPDNLIAAQEQLENALNDFMEGADRDGE